MYFIARGTLHVSIKKRYIKELNEGESFGEIAVIRTDNKRSASVHAYDHSSLYELTRHGVRQLMVEHPNALRNAIAQHFEKSSPGGNRQALVFARRGSVARFQEGLHDEKWAQADESNTLTPKVETKLNRGQKDGVPQGTHTITRTLSTSSQYIPTEQESRAIEMGTANAEDLRALHRDDDKAAPKPPSESGEGIRRGSQIENC